MKYLSFVATVDFDIVSGIICNLPTLLTLWVERIGLVNLNPKGGGTNSVLKTSTNFEVLNVLRKLLHGWLERLSVTTTWQA